MRLLQKEGGFAFVITRDDHDYRQSFGNTIRGMATAVKRGKHCLCKTRLVLCSARGQSASGDFAGGRGGGFCGNNAGRGGNLSS